MQVCLSNVYGILLPPDIEGLKLLYIMPGGNKRSYILNENLQLKKAANADFFKYIWPFVTNRQ